MTDVASIKTAKTALLKATEIKMTAELRLGTAAHISHQLFMFIVASYYAANNGPCKYII